MSTHASDTGAPNKDATDDRYAALRIADDTVVIYDQSNHRAWVQSTRTALLRDMV